MQLKKLILACKNKDRKAQRVLVDTFAPTLMSIGLRYLKNEEDAKDVMQESFIQIFNHIDQFQKEETYFKAWCCRITINTALSKFRKASYYREVQLNQDFLEETTPPVAIEMLKVDDILKMMEKLPDILRHVFNLAIIDGYKHAEIAKCLKIKESSSRTFLVRARKLMQEMIIQSETFIRNET